MRSGFITTADNRYFEYQATGFVHKFGSLSRVCFPGYEPQR